MEQNQRDLRPGWVKARDEGRPLNWQQELAERTNGVVRLPNLMTATGICLNGLGAYLAYRGRYGASAISTIAGFGCDAEGFVARLSGTEDPVNGARFDQLADAAKASISVGGLLTAEVLPPAAAILTYSPKVANMVVGVATQTELTSSKVGKCAEAIRDVVPAAFLLAKIGEVYDRPSVQKVGRTLGWTAVGASLAVGMTATIGYVRDALEAKKSADLSARPAKSLDCAES